MSYLLIVEREMAKSIQREQDRSFLKMTAKEELAAIADRFSAEHGRLDCALADANTKANHFESRCNTLSELLNDSERVKKQLVNDISKAYLKIEELKDRLAGQEAELSAAVARSSQLFEENRKLDIEFNSCREWKNDLLNKSRKQDDEIARLRNANVGLQQRLEEAEDMIGSHRKYAEKMAEAEKKIDGLNAELQVAYGAVRMHALTIKAVKEATKGY